MTESEFAHLGNDSASSEVQRSRLVRTLAQSYSVHQLVDRFAAAMGDLWQEDALLLAIERQRYDPQDYVSSEALLRHVLSAYVVCGLEWASTFVQGDSPLAIESIVRLAQSLELESDAALLFAQVPFAARWDNPEIRSRIEPQRWLRLVELMRL